jgi:hypothetical protein
MRNTKNWNWGKTILCLLAALQAIFPHSNAQMAQHSEDVSHRVCHRYQRINCQYPMAMRKFPESKDISKGCLVEELSAGEDIRTEY